MSTGPHFGASAYLERIGIDGPIRPVASDLARLHRAQRCTIPFENFDILLGRPIDIGPAAIFAKLVERRRGGYCFEQNGLFMSALAAFGFEARFALARVHLGPQPTGLTHVLILVRIGGEDWLADVGFGGGGPRAPLRLVRDVVQRHDRLAFRLVECAPFGTMLEVETDGSWRRLYSFEDRPVLPVDLALGNHYTSSHPDSFFTYARVASRVEPDGRTALYDHRLTIERGGVTTEETVGGGAAYIEMLAQRFGIELDAPFEALRPLHPPPAER